MTESTVRRGICDGNVNMIEAKLREEEGVGKSDLHQALVY